MENQTTIVVITPQGEPFSKRIIKHVENYGHIIFYTRVTLNDEMLQSIEPDIAGERRVAVWEQLFDKSVLVLVVRGNLIINTLQSEIGKEPNPNNCDLQSLNYCLQKETGLQPTGHMLDDSTFFYRKFLYCSTSLEQAEQQMKVFLNGAYERVKNAN